MSQQGDKHLQEKEKYEQQIKKLLQEDLDKNSKPLWLTKQFVEKPICVIVVCCIIFIISIVLVAALELFSFNENTNRDYLIWSNERVQQYDAWTQMQQEFQENLQDTQVPERSQEEDLWITNIMIQCEECDNILESKYIEVLYDFEQKIKKLTNYDKLCLASTESTDCAPESYISTMVLFPDQEGKDLKESEIDAMKDFVLAEENFDTWKYLFGSDFNEDNKKTKILRSIFKFGLPLKMDGKIYKDRFDEFNEQKEYFTEFSQKIIDIQKDYDDEYKDEDFRVLVFSRRIDAIVFQSIIDSDFMWAFASIVFVWFYITMHLHSFFLGSIAMFNILMSFPLTVVIFRLIFQITYFSSLHILAVFVVLGIAADDVFVFMDAWGQTQFYEQLQGDLNKRMAVTFRRAAKAMVATSSTTSAAFFATGLSTIMPISSFGFFAGVLVPMNFILVITFFPAVLIVQNKYFKHMCTKKNNKQKEVQSQRSDSQVVPVQNQEQFQEQNQDQVNENKQMQDNQNEEKQEPLMERFFGNQFNNFIFKGRYIILLVFTIWIGIAIWRTSEMSPITEPEKFLPDDSVVEIAESNLRTEFHQSGASDNGIKVFLTWGIDGIDKEEVSMWDPEDLGEIIWDDDFDLSPEENQQAFLEICQDLKTNELVQDEEVMCFMEGFYGWLLARSETFPVPESQFIDKLTEFAKDPAGGLLFFNQNQIGLIKGELKYVYIILSSVGTPFTPYDQLNPLYEKWEDLEDKINKDAPKGINNMTQSAAFHWVWMISERAFVTNAIQGMTISLAFACVVLLLSTHNIIISIYSIISISGIVVSVVAIMQLSGWELGIAESITIVILIGLSVDFVVHLANHYVESVYPDRFRRMQISLKEIAISIVSGAVTTMGAGIFLFFAVVIIFNKFAILIVATILFSLSFSLFFFSALLHAFGPQNDVGNLLVLCRKKNKNSNQQLENNNNNENNQEGVQVQDVQIEKQEEKQQSNEINSQGQGLEISKENKQAHQPDLEQVV